MGFNIRTLFKANDVVWPNIYAVEGGTEDAVIAIGPVWKIMSQSELWENFQRWWFLNDFLTAWEIPRCAPQMASPFW